MRYLLLLLLCVPFIGFGQLTYIPDANFETYLESNGMGNGVSNDNYVFTSSIDTTTVLNINNLSISSLEGIASFSSLSNLNCSGNLLTSLDLSQNTSLTYLEASSNGSLVSLNITNGNNQNVTYFNTQGNSLLYCIGVDNVSWSQLNWTMIMPQHVFVESYLTEVVTACDSYTWNNSTYTSSGVYSFYGGATNIWCDTVKILRLTINNSSVSSYDTVDVCDDYTWNGTVYTTSVIDSVVFTNSLGCDSIAILVLTIRESNTSTSSVTTCDDYFWADSTLTSTGTYYHYTTNVAGCDSIATLNLTINNSTSSSSIDTACDSYTWLTNGLTYTSSGIYTKISTNSSGCAHVDSLNLTINYSSSSSDTVDMCDNYTWNGGTYTTSGVYDSLFSNSVGCDSLATLVLTIRNSTQSSNFEIACDSFTWEGFYTLDSTLTSSGIYTHYTTNSVGCDSTATLNLTINNSTGSTQVASACDSYTWAAANGMILSETGVTTYISTNSDGCPNIDTLILMIEYSSSSTDTISACGHYTWNGTVYTESGIYDSLFTNSVGCDSTTTLVLTIGYPTSSVLIDTACYDYIWNNSTYTSSGIYTYVTTNNLGCANTDSLVLTMNPSHNMTMSNTIINACGDYTWNDSTYTASGVYTFNTLNSQGCDSLAELTLTVINVDKPTIEQYWSTTFKSSESYAYQWYRDGDILEGETDQYLNFDQAGSYTVTAINIDNCFKMSDAFVIGEENNMISFPNDEINNLIVYPVPSQNTITIKVDTRKPMSYVVDIIDYQGNLVKQTNESLDYIQSIDIQNLSNGIYFINVWFEDGTFINNIITKQ